MDIDLLARQIHRRGLLAGLIALLPAAASAQPRCAVAGEGCTIMVPCCSGECVTLPLNPNAGVCGGTSDDDDDSDLTCEEAAREYGLSGRPTCQSFACREDAQDFFDAFFPDDPCGLDGVEGPTTDGVPNVVCEHVPLCGFQGAQERPQRRRRRSWRRRHVGVR